jgi:hypothetical protein
MVDTVGGDVDPHRFRSDVAYLTHFAAGIGDCLGTKTILNAVIEDATSQTAFYYTSGDVSGPIVNGIFTRKIRPPGELLDSLHED